MNKMDTYIMVVPREKLLGEDHFDGFLRHIDHDYYNRITNHYFYMRRGDAEENPSFKQPIAYTVIVDSETKTVLGYQRASTQAAYTESRLYGKWSWGLGGHVDKEDAFFEDPVKASMIRELREEIALNLDDHQPDLLGYVNIDDGVGSVHFGVVYVIPITGRQLIDFGSDELAQAAFLEISELKKMLASQDVEVETWSEVLVPALEEWFDTYSV